MGRLERHLDLDAVRRVQAGIRFKDEPMKHVTSEPKPASSYRAARRNAHRGFMWEGVKAKYFPPAPWRENKKDHCIESDDIRKVQVADRPRIRPSIALSMLAAGGVMGHRFMRPFRGRG